MKHSEIIFNVTDLNGSADCVDRKFKADEIEGVAVETTQYGMCCVIETARTRYAVNGDWTTKTAHDVHRAVTRKLGI